MTCPRCNETATVAREMPGGQAWEHGVNEHGGTVMCFEPRPRALKPTQRQGESKALGFGPLERTKPLKGWHN